MCSILISTEKGSGLEKMEQTTSGWLVDLSHELVLNSLKTAPNVSCWQEESADLKTFLAYQFSIMGDIVIPASSLHQSVIISTRTEKVYLLSRRKLKFFLSFSE